ncbi:PLC-like phosphodiesterase [Limtongia smithiae]|uniref:PLC-like phosphodiesterase n=1 Tax=Limtongia smithiae TaxID=1125753 RepID=UPI0034CF7648
MAEDDTKLTPATAPLLPVVFSEGSELRNRLQLIYSKSRAQAEGCTLDEFAQSLRYTPIPATLDTSRPFTNYFISSSHNTYLIGDQLRGHASIQGYINVLSRGCRCLEIDVWNGKNSEPKVVHGWTAVAPIPFRDVCKAIAEYAFKSTPFPLLVSLENHCDVAQQGIVSDIMHEEFGTMLLTQPLTSVPELPSLEELKFKILVITAPNDVSDILNADDPEYLSKVRASADEGGSSSDSDGGDTGSDGSEDPEDERDRDATERKPEEVEGAQKVETSSINPKLGSLGIYVVPRPFVNLMSKLSTEFNHIHNVSERMFSNLENHPIPVALCSPDEPSPESKLTPRAVIQHNARYLMRIYPNGYRFNSSNPYPPAYWAYGAQIVALNWQKIDRSTMLNQALFEGSGGYVLKPETELGLAETADGKDLDAKIFSLTNKVKDNLHIQSRHFDKFASHFKHASGSDPGAVHIDPSLSLKRLGKLQVQLFGVQDLPLPPHSDLSSIADLHPYAKLECIQAHIKSKKLDTQGILPVGKVVHETVHRTSSLKGPTVFWDATWTFTITSDLAFLRFKFYHNNGLLSKNEPCAWFATRIGNFDQGYCIVHPYSMSGSAVGDSCVALLNFSWLE